MRIVLPVEHKSHILWFIVMVIVFLLLFVLFSCGRRGDPVAVEPRSERDLQQRKESDDAPREVKRDVIPVKERGIVEAPAAPTNLIAIYTGSSIVLTWNDIDEHDISIYRIYRAEDGEFQMIGESATPAFTDRDITADRKYSYRVSAVADSEGPLSKVIFISTTKNPK